MNPWQVPEVVYRTSVEGKNTVVQLKLQECDEFVFCNVVGVFQKSFIPSCEVCSVDFLL